jgi:hypothetical protein
MAAHITGTREEWLAARLELLEAEKELTRRSDELARRRQELPWVRVDKEHAMDPTVPHMLGQTKQREQRCQTGHPEENRRHRSHSIDLNTGHYSYRDLKKDCTCSTLAGTSDPRPRSGQQSIPIGHALGNGLVQPIFWTLGQIQQAGAGGSPATGRR